MSKVKATKELVSTAANGHIFSNPIKLTKLFRPEKLINALRQYIARSNPTNFFIQMKTSFMFKEQNSQMIVT